MKSPLDIFHPLIRSWFNTAYGTPTDIQARAWPVIARGEHALITAPTGSGKTLTAFLFAIDRLITGAWPCGGTRVLYVSPMKALNNDIQRNLRGPLDALRATFKTEGVAFPDVRVATRSGDTPADERRRMAKRPPEILILTPESLNLIHSSPKTRTMLSGIRTVILDEIHAVAGSKRGVHTFTAVERLLLYNDEFQRIALSATVKPPGLVAEMVGGYEPSMRITPAGCEIDPGEISYTKRPVRVVESTQAKAYELMVRYPPVNEEPPDDGSRWPVLTDALREILAHNTSTLIFTNTRRHCERVSMLLNGGESDLRVYAHHGSLSREIRAVVEQRLKEGELDAIVATNSLELGIDIGHLDSVVMVQTPPGVASTLQRLGRAGHRVGEVSRGVLFPMFGRDLLEAAVMKKAVDERDMESLRAPRSPLDVLAQIILSITGVEEWDIDALYAFLRCSAPYRGLDRGRFDLVLAMLRGRYAESRIRALQSLVAIDADKNTISAKSAALRTIYSSGGTIPDRGYFNLRLSDTNAKIGELDEEFVWERHLGETFTLGNQTWKIQAITHNDVMVRPSDGVLRMVPFWKAETFSRGFHFSERTSEFLERIEPLLKKPGARRLLLDECGLDGSAADALIEFLQRQREATGASLPHRHHLLIERCTDVRRNSERTQLILHTLWGGSVNRPVSLALAQAWEEKAGESVEVFADNDCIVVVLPEQDSNVDPFEILQGQDIEGLLRKRLEQTGLFGARFRENAARALLLPRQTFGKRMPLWMNRIRSKRLLEAVAGYDDFPILIETWRTCLQDEFELDQAVALLREVRDGIIRRSEVRTSLPSPFAGGIDWGQTNKYMYESDAPDGPLTSNLREEFYRTVAQSQALRPLLDPGLCKTFEEKAGRIHPGYAPAPGAELRDWIADRLYLPAAEWTALCEAVSRDHDRSVRAVRESVAGTVVEVSGGIVAKEMLDRFRRFCGDDDPEREENSPANWLSEWLRYYGPVSRVSIVQMLPFDEDVVSARLDELLDARTLVSGELIRGRNDTLVCDAENLEILLRISRREGEARITARPVTDLPLFIAQVQGLTAPGDDPLDAIETLLGLPCDPASLESEFLPARVAAYRPAMLDEAAASTGLAWIGQRGKRIRLTVPETTDLFGADESGESTLLPGHVGRYTLEELMDHSPAASGELTARLWEEVWGGVLTNDSFEALRTGIRTRFQASDLAGAKRTSRRSGFRAWRATRPFTGHWRRAPRSEPAQDELDELERGKDRARVLLDRYGVLCRALLQHERPGMRWGAVFRALRIMELSGEVTTGHFFEGINGLQFLATAAVGEFQQALPEDAVYWMNATDPASLSGLDIEETKAALPKRLKSTHYVMHGARLRLESERSGKVLRIHAAPDAAELPRYFCVFEHMLSRAVSPRSAVHIDTINDEPATASPFLDALRDRFEVHTDPKRVTLYRQRNV